MKVRFIRMNQKWANNRIKAAAGMLGVNRTMDEFTGRLAAAAPSDPSPIPGPPTAEG